MNATEEIGNGLKIFASDLVNGLFEITHNGFALIGLAVAFAAVTLTARPDWRDTGEQHLRGWLYSRLSPDVALVAEDTSDRALATNPRELPREQAAVAYWLAKKYRVAPEPLSLIVAEAYEIGKRTKLDPTLLLAVMAIESSFNPFAQSSVGAQGLMQVMTRVHTEKYENSGGPLAAFNPVTNLRVGAKVLLDCIARAGSIEGALKQYVGAANLPSDGGYGAKVLAERTRLLQVAAGREVPPEYSQTQAAPVRVGPSAVAVASQAARAGGAEKLAWLAN
ncbi:MAG: lytic transglycosylase domain-containing protein [Burkholderiales bacterium]